jgi:prevent-host-death family protein
VRTVEIDEATAHLSRLIDEAVGGEPFIIARSGKPLVKVVAVEVTAPKGRRMGFMSGQVSVPEDFDSMGREEIEQLFASHP